MTLDRASKIDLIRAFGKLTLKQVVDNKYPSIGQLEKQHSKDKSELVTQIILTELSHTFNDELSKEHVEELVAEIHSSIYRNLSFEDLFLVCKEIKSNDHNRRLTVSKVLSYLKKHHEKRCDMIYQKNLNFHLANRPDNSQRGMSKEQILERHKTVMAEAKKKEDLKQTQQELNKVQKNGKQ